MKSIKIIGLVAFTALALTAFSGVASASGSGLFEAGSYPATLKGEATGEKGQISTDLGIVPCTSPNLEGSLSKASEAATTSFEWPYPSCGFQSWEHQSCQLTFHPPAEGVNGTFDIGGSECTGIHGTLGSSTVILPQTGLAATFENQGSGSTATVKIHAQAIGMKYEITAGASKGTYSDGHWTTTWTMKGEHAGSSTAVSVHPHPGFSIVGEGEGRVFHSEYYPVTISGEQISGTVGGKEVTKNELTTGAGTLKCTPLTFSSQPTWPEGEVEDSVSQSLSPTYGSCNLGGLAGATVTPEAGCTFAFRLSGNLHLCNLAISREACQITVPAQEQAGLEFFNKGTGSSSYVETKVNLSGLKYQIAGSGCPNKIEPGSYSNGTYKGVIKLR